MPPIALTPAPRLTTPQPVRPTTIRPVVAPRQTQILKSSHEWAQLSLFPRPNGAR